MSCYNVNLFPILIGLNQPNTALFVYCSSWMLFVVFLPKLTKNRGIITSYTFNVAVLSFFYPFTYGDNNISVWLQVNFHNKTRIDITNTKSVAWQTIHILRISICYRLKDKNKVFIGGFSLFIRLPWISRLQRYSTWRLRSYLRPYTWNYLWIQLGIFIVFTYKICSKNVSHELKQIWSEKW